MKDHRFNKLTRSILNLGILVIAFVYLYNKVNLSEVLKLLLNTNILLYMVVFMMFVGNIYISSLKWQLLLRLIGVNLTRKEAFSLYTKGFIYNYFLPSTIGGDVVKTYGLKNKKEKNSWFSLYLTTFLDRFLGLLAILTIMFISSLFVETNSLTLFRIIPVGIIVVTVILFYYRDFFFTNINRIVINSRLQRLLHEVKLSLDLLANNKNCFAKIIMISFIFHLFGILAQYILLISVGATLTLTLAYFLISTTRLFESLPISFHGVGVKETVFVYLGTMFGINTDIIITYSILFYSILVIFINLVFLYNIISKLLAMFKPNRNLVE